MSFETWGVFFVSYLFITLAPGPNVLFVVQNAMKYGYKEALLSIFGNLSCQAIIVVLVSFGAGAILEQSPSAFFILKVIGGLYLIYIGVKGLLKNDSPKSNTKNSIAREASNKLLICKTGFFVSASNPKTVIFLSAFLPQFITSDYPVESQFLLMFFSICVIVLVVHLLYSYIAKNIGRNLKNKLIGRVFSKIYNSIFVVFGGGIILSNR